MVIHVIDVGRLRTWQLRESEIWPNNFVEAFLGVSDPGPQGDGGALLILALLANTSARPRVCTALSSSSPPRPSGGGQVLQ